MLTATPPPPPPPPPQPITNKGIFLTLFCKLKSKWSLVPGPLSFSKSCQLKKTTFEIKNKVNFLRLFENPLSKYLFLKEFLACNGCFQLFAKIKRGLGLAFGAHFPGDFFHKNVSYLMLHQLTKFQCHTFFPSQDIKQNKL